MPIFCLWETLGFLAMYESLSYSPECFFENDFSWVSLIIFTISGALLVVYFISILAFLFEYVRII